ncbi:acetolactate synthase 2 small subunit [Neptunicella sp. SCSIO 80796]|uniref:acetolactate synthase 2 small subunit n=1 Tax=Neptunicella plasticusilytica TaxID=3117012 RepID=UPI003A4E2394
MHYQLNLLLTDSPAAIERVLQTTRYRGFTLHQCEMQTASGEIQLNMQVSGEQPIHLLTSQLSKLYDLLELVLDPSSVRVNRLFEPQVDALAVS